MGLTRTTSLSGIRRARTRAALYPAKPAPMIAIVGRAMAPHHGADGGGAPRAETGRRTGLSLCVTGVGSEGGVPAVRDEYRAGDEAGGVTREEEDGWGQLFDGAVPLQWGVLDPVLPVLRFVHRRHVRLDVAGREGVDAD